MANIKFEYLYRDAANYKQYGGITFSNPENLSLTELELFIKKHLIEEEFFDHDTFNLPPLFFDCFDAELDHPFHEFVGVSCTSDLPTDTRTISAFIQSISKNKTIHTNL